MDNLYSWVLAAVVVVFMIPIGQFWLIATLVGGSWSLFIISGYIVSIGELSVGPPFVRILGVVTFIFLTMGLLTYMGIGPNVQLFDIEMFGICEFGYCE